jgi:putative spermidine/putrescine transport system ATP-binding protein
VRRDLVRLARADAAGLPAIDAVSGIIRAVEYQGTYLKVTLIVDPPGLPGEANEAFVVYVDESAYFQALVLAGQRATGWWEIDEALLLAAE